MTRLATVRANGGYDRWVRRTDVPLLLLALAFLGVLLLPLTGDLSALVTTALTVASITIWAVFGADYAVRLYLAIDRWRFVRTHVLDLLVIALPMLRPLRAFRLLRLARLGTVMGVASRRGQRSLHARVSAYVAGSGTDPYVFIHQVDDVASVGWEARAPPD